jgi:hypothetical protein
MARNSEIQNVFEIADDSLQGVLGNHYYVMALYQQRERAKLLESLPQVAIPHTFSWIRYYDRADLINSLEPILEFVQSRQSLVAMVCVFEAALSSFVSHLASLGQEPRVDGELIGGDASYKRKIIWAHSRALTCDTGDKTAIDRLPGTFGIIDNARRLRNDIVHNRGFYGDRYETDAIRSESVVVDFDEEYQSQSRDAPCAIRLTTPRIVNFSRSHIEALHILHNEIQRHCFGHSEPYDYSKENKGIGWGRVFSGI